VRILCVILAAMGAYAGVLLALGVRWKHLRTR
jgi:hypothetical protein